MRGWTHPVKLSWATVFLTTSMAPLYRPEGAVWSLVFIRSKGWPVSQFQRPATIQKVMAHRRRQRKSLQCHQRWMIWTARLRISLEQHCLTVKSRNVSNACMILIHLLTMSLAGSKYQTMRDMNSVCLPSRTTKSLWYVYDERMNFTCWWRTPVKE